MDKFLLDNVKMPKDWVLIPRNLYSKIGIYEDEESIVCLGVYGNRAYPETSTVVYSYGTNYGEFLENYLGLIYDNDCDSFIPSEIKDETFMKDKGMDNIYSGDQVYGKRKFIVNVFKISQGQLATYSAQFFVVYKGNLINFTCSASKIDEKNVYPSLINNNPHIRKMIIELFKIL